MDRYARKRAVITGGASGMGLAAAKLLLGEGARVMITAHGQSTLGEALAQLGEAAVGVVSDAAKLSDIDELAAQVKQKLGGIDALFICAGQTRFVPLEQMTEEVYDTLMAVNAKGAYFTVQKLASLIVDGGAVVVITSVADALGQPMISAYAASKAALRSMTRSLARELLPRAIRVNAVSPGPIDSGILEKSMPEEQAQKTRQQMIDRNPMKRFGTPEEVAAAMIFLAFEATYTNGFEFVIDGGSTQL